MVTLSPSVDSLSFSYEYTRTFSPAVQNPGTIVIDKRAGGKQKRGSTTVQWHPILSGEEEGGRGGGGQRGGGRGAQEPFSKRALGTIAATVTRQFRCWVGRRKIIVQQFRKNSHYAKSKIRVSLTVSQEVKYLCCKNLRLRFSSNLQFPGP